jgi:hypothetical protein
VRYPAFFVAVTDYTPLGLLRHDIVRYDPTSDRTLEVYRRLPPNHGSLLNAIELGAVMPSDGDVLVEQLRRDLAEGHAPPPPQTPPLRLIRDAG